MAQSPGFQNQRIPSTQAFWLGGMDSNKQPLILAPSQYQCGFNTICRGGDVAVRPRHRLVLSVPGVRPQALCLFTPTGETLPVLVVVTDGYIHISRWPYTTLEFLSAPLLDPTAPQVFCTVVTKSVRQETSGVLTLIPAQSILILSDGRSRPVRWDGIKPATGINPQPPTFGVPAAAGPGVFSNGRAWFAVGNKIYASNLGDPDTFTETLIVAEGGFIPTPSDVTCLIESPDRSGIVAFTDSTAFFIQSSLKVRTSWQTDPGFFTSLLTGIGCAGAKAAINQFGQTWFFSPGGLLSLDAARQTYQTSRVLYQDLPMARSKDNLSEDCSEACLCAHDDYLLCSVPSGSKDNRHTWCYDQNAGNGPAWAGIWTGVQPVEYATAVINGETRTFFLSLDTHATGDGAHIHVWEAFGNGQEEPSGRVVANMQTSLFQVAAIEPTAFVSAEIHLSGVEGNVNVKAWVGRNAGGYLPVLDRNLVAPRGPFRPGWLSTDNGGIIDAFRPQKRIVTTAYLNQVLAADEPDAAASQQQENGESQPIGTGRTISMLIQIAGVAAVEAVRVVQDTRPTQTDAKCLDDENAATGLPLLADDYRTEFEYYSL